MKNILSTIVLLFLTLTQIHAIIITTPNIGQTQYRWRNDDGNQTAATWKAAVNTPVIITATDVVRLRMELANTGSGGGTIDQTLEYSSNNGANWTTMNNPATNAFTYQTSTFVANGNATTQQLPNTTAGTFVAGRIITAVAAAVNLVNGNKTEYEWVIKPTANVLPSTTYIFRSVGQQATPVAIYPSLTTACSGNPTAGAVDAPTSVVCNTSATLGLLGNTNGPGISFHWQYNSPGGWIDFGGNTNTQLSPAIVQNTEFRCLIKCISGGKDSTASFLITPEPLHVDLGPDFNICIDENGAAVLDAGYHPFSPVFLWDDNTSGQVRAIEESGTYSVKVTDMYTCSGSDTIRGVLRKNPMVNLGNDTTVCNGVTLPLNSGDGNIQYFWNTGQTTQSINVNEAGTYSVFVTSDEGCVVTDTIKIKTEGQLPSIQGIQVSNDGNRTFHFMTLSPQNVIGYDWDFGDGSQHSYEASPYHKYDNVGDYVVVLHLSSICGFTNDTLGAHIVGINQLNITNDVISVYPNPSKGQTTILNKGDLKMSKIEIYNMFGQVVYRSTADSNKTHTLDLGAMASGVYTIEIYTDKGTVARKLEILK